MRNLRHAHASWLLAGGADIHVVTERLGHATITTTEWYLHTAGGRRDGPSCGLSESRPFVGDSPRAIGSVSAAE
jgi:hypothetical protein